MNSIVVDGNNYVMIAMSVAISSGNIMNTRHILGNMMGKLFRTFGNDSRYYVCFDSRGGTEFRKDIDPNYKATRTYESEKIDALEDVKDLFYDNEFMDCTLDSCEADDAIFVLCRILAETEDKDDIYVVSRDKDMIQIAQEGYAGHIWDPSKKKDMEIPDYSMVEFKALTGDTSDNISGIKGVGPKTALKILNGEKQLTEEQKVKFRENLTLIDARLNPRYNDNIGIMREMLREKV